MEYKRFCKTLAELEAYVSKFQRTSAEASADEKWQLIERIYKLNE